MWIMCLRGLSSSSVVPHLEVGALTQDVMADVQVAVGRGPGSFSRGLLRGPARQASLGKRLQVVRRHGPEVQIRLVSKQPAENQDQDQDQDQASVLQSDLIW